ncbi:MAG TPA: hypothetical protein VNW06_09535, partial [Cytophagaceae bacterium]|nr:hypothetical protein [Cytophagaceae bacterium]
MKKYSKSIGIIIFGFVFITTNFWFGNYVMEKKFKEYKIYSDAVGYYIYLPSFFINKDVDSQYGYSLPNGKFINKYNYGVAFFEMPVFLIQYKLAGLFKTQPDTYGIYYGRGILLSASIYLFFGLLMLYSYLKQLFGSFTSIVTILLVYLATNLLYYATVEPGMSHVYTFFCVCGVLYFTEKSIRTNYLKYHIANAFLIALIILIRPINLPVVFFFLFYDLYNFKDIKNRMYFYLRNIRLPLIYIGALLIVFIPQIAYWKIVTGHYLVYSYGYNNESFIYWKCPKFSDVYFGSQCGWLSYTPVMGFALVGLVILVIKKKYNGLAIVLTMLFISYLCASWWCNFSCAFGYRSFVEYYPLLSIPLAWFMKKYIIDKSVILTGMFIVTMIYINISITY